MDGAPDALLKLIPTQEASCSLGRETDACPGFRYGTTSKHSQAKNGAVTSTSSPEGSPARIFHAQTRKLRESQVKEAGFGWKWPESLMKWDQDTCSWKMRQCSLLVGLDEFSGTWPTWGMMRDGECWELIAPAWTIPGKDSGLLPTPLASDHRGGHTKGRAATPRTKAGRPRAWRDYVNQEYDMTYPHPTHSELRMAWPIGWTALEPLEMGKFRQWLELHTNSYRGNCIHE